MACYECFELSFHDRKKKDKEGEGNQSPNTLSTSGKICKMMIVWKYLYDLIWDKDWLQYSTYFNHELLKLNKQANRGITFEKKVKHL